MSAYIAFFAALTLVAILYVIIYNRLVFSPKIKRLNLANEFRYATNLNRYLLTQLTTHAAELKQIDNKFNDIDVLMHKLQSWHDKARNNNIFRSVNNTEKNELPFDVLLADINQQIKLLHEIRTDLNRALLYRNLAV